MRDDFLFVNADPSPNATAASRRRESARVRSYVQYSRRKAERASRASSAASSSEFTTDLTVLENHSRPSTRENSAVASPVPQVMELPRVYPTNNATDPFNSTAAGADAGSSYFLQMTYEACTTPSFLSESFAPEAICANGSSARHERLFRDRQRRCIEDPVLMYATLAYGSSLMAWTMNGQAPDGKSVDYFMGVALQNLRIRLSTLDQDQVDEWLLISIWCLAATELWSASPSLWQKGSVNQQMAVQKRQHGLEACQMHVTTLWRLVENAGGWNHFSTFIYDCGMLAVKYLSIAKGVSPIKCGTQDVDPVRLQQQLPHDPQPQLATALHPRIQDDGLRKTLDIFIKHVKLSEHIWGSGNIDPHSEMLIFRKHQEVAMRLQAHSCPDNCLQNMIDLSDPDMCVCLTLLVIHLNVTVHSGPRASAGLPARRLQKLLQKTTSQTLDFEMKLWTLFSCAMSPVEFPERSWFIEEILAQDLSVFRSRGDVEALLEAWFFLPARQDKVLAQLLDTLNFT